MLGLHFTEGTGWTVLTWVLNALVQPASLGSMVHKWLLLLPALFIQPATTVLAHQERYIHFAGTAQAAMGVVAYRPVLAVCIRWFTLQAWMTRKTFIPFSRASATTDPRLRALCMRSANSLPRRT